MARPQIHGNGGLPAGAGQGRSLAKSSTGVESEQITKMRQNIGLPAVPNNSKIPAEESPGAQGQPPIIHAPHDGGSLMMDQDGVVGASTEQREGGARATTDLNSVGARRGTEESTGAQAQAPTIQREEGSNGATTELSSLAKDTIAVAVEQLKENQEDMLTKISQDHNAVEQLKAQVASNEDAQKKNQSEQKEKVNSLADQVNELLDLGNTRAAINKQAHEELEAALRTRSEAIKLTVSNLQKVENDAADNRARIGHLEDTQGESALAITALQASDAMNGAEIKELQANLKSLQASDAKKGAEIEELKDNLMSLQASDAKKNKEIKKLKKKNDEYEGKPKRPLTAFNLFTRAQHIVLEFSPETSFGDKSNRIAALWKNLPNKEKEKYEQEAKLLQEDYSQKMVEWKQNKGIERKKMLPQEECIPEESTLQGESTDSPTVSSERSKRKKHHSETSGDSAKRRKKTSSRAMNQTSILEKTKHQLDPVFLKKDGKNDVYNDPVQILEDRICSKEEVWVKFSTDESVHKVKKSQLVYKLPPRSRKACKAPVGTTFHKKMTSGNYRGVHWRKAKVIEVMEGNSMFPNFYYVSLSLAKH